MNIVAQKIDSGTTYRLTSQRGVIVGILLNLLTMYFAPAEAAAASQSGTTIPSAPQIIAGTGDVWTRSDGIDENGIARD